jgi:primosomal protein N' (replication factor Y) (superfamily II helicase)
MTAHKIAKILLPHAKLFPLSYYIQAGMDLKIGNLVIVPFKNKDSVGIVWEFANDAEGIKNIKYIKDLIDPSLILNEEILALIRKASAYYISELGSIAKLVLPIDVAYHRHPELGSGSKPGGNEISDQVRDDYLVQDDGSFQLPPLSTLQQSALDEIRRIEKPIVIKGITGSGKTEVYFHLIADYLKLNKQCLIMLPEISLSTQIIKRFTERFGFEPVVWNSSITKSKKQKFFASIISGKANIIIGARSSLFLPYKNLGLIIVDEEHDSSYKQEDNVLYNARDMAVLRSHLVGAKILLCSATPSIETIYNISCNKYHLIELKERYNNATLPKVDIIDMRGVKLSKNKWISPTLISAIEANLQNKEQALLFLNRRGYSPLLICRSCGFRVNCVNCTSWLVMHKASKRLECHHCGYLAAIPTSCKECGASDSLYPCGPGIERIEEEVKELFPDAKIAMISKDQTKKLADLKHILRQMELGEIDILIGTQVITKGYHFPNLTLVGVIDADLGLSQIDLRSAEKNFQLLYQVGGRAGREAKQGSLFLQTYQPNNIIFESLKNYKIDDFINYELDTRKAVNMPPFGKMAALIFSGKNEERLFYFAKTVVSMAPITENIRILGPARALMAKLAGRYRYRVIIISGKQFPLQKYLNSWLSAVKIPSGIHTKIDVDPQSFG